MTDSISKVPASPTHARDSVKAVVDEYGIPLGAEVEIDGVGISLPTEQFSSADSEMAYPKIIWVDGHTRREIFIDHVHKTSYVRSIRDDNPIVALAQAVYTVVHTVVEHITTSAKAAGGLDSKPHEKLKEAAPPSPADTIVAGGLNLEKPKTEATAVAETPTDPSRAVAGLQTPAANAFLRSAMLFAETDDKTRPRAMSQSAASNTVSLDVTDQQRERWAEGSAGIPKNHVDRHEGEYGVPRPAPSPLISGATYIWRAEHTQEGAADHTAPLSPTLSPSSLSVRASDAREITPSHGNSVSELKDSEPDDRLPHAVTAPAEKAPHPAQNLTPPDKAPIVLGEEGFNPVGAPVAPPPPAILTVFAAPKLPAIKDSTVVERPSRSSSSDGEGRDQQGKRDGQHNPQDDPHPEQ